MCPWNIYVYVFVCSIHALKYDIGPTKVHSYPAVSIADAHTILCPMFVVKGVQLTVASKLPSLFRLIVDMAKTSPYRPVMINLLIFLKYYNTLFHPCNTKTSKCVFPKNRKTLKHKYAILSI